MDPNQDINPNSNIPITPPTQETQNNSSSVLTSQIQQQPSKHRFIKILILITIAAISLISIATAVILLNKYSTKPKTAENLSKTTIAQHFIPPVVAAFQKYLTSSTSAIILYDFSTKSSTDLTSSVIFENDALPSIGIWSPDGKYLPIQFHRSLADNKPLPFYFYDLKNNKAIQLVDANEKPQLENSFQSFLAHWLNNTTIYL